MVTHAFVRPGRYHDFVTCGACVSSELARRVMSTHGGVPLSKGTDPALVSGLVSRIVSSMAGGHYGQ